jgi:hypothetical protein
MTRAAVEERVRADRHEGRRRQRSSRSSASANVLTVGKTTEDGLASSFQIRVGNPPSLDGDVDESRISRDVQERGCRCVRRRTSTSACRLSSTNSASRATTRAVHPSAREGPRRRLDRSSRTARASLLASSAAAWPSSIDSLKTADHGG